MFSQLPQSPIQSDILIYEALPSDTSLHFKSVIKWTVTIQGVSGGIVNILGACSMDYSE